MLRLCLTLGACCLLCGCSQRSIEGAWYGPLPLGGGQDCRIRIMKGGRFEFTCKPDLVGQGNYTQEDDNLTLSFLWVAKDGGPTAAPAPVQLKLTGEGNLIRARTQEGTTLTWERRMK